MKVFRTAIVLLLLLAAGVFGAQWLAHDSMRDLGEVFVRAGGYDFSASLPGALLAIAACFLLLWLGWRLLALPFHAWGRYRRKQSRARLTEGLEALHGGERGRARICAYDAVVLAVPAAQVALHRGEHGPVVVHRKDDGLGHNLLPGARHRAAMTG